MALLGTYLWTKIAERGESLFEPGQRRYEQENSSFSYRNCVVVDIGNKVISMMVAFPMENPDTDDSLADNDADPVLAPFSKLEEYDSYYIFGIAFFSNYRGRGIGKKLVALAEDNCLELGLKKLSLIVFEQNTSAKRQYENLGFKTVMTETVVLHPLINYIGKACLMVKNLNA